MKVKKVSEHFKIAKLFFDPEYHSDELTFPQICSFIREVFDVSKTEMAEKLGVTLDGYRLWETGKREPSSKAAFNLCILYLQAIEFQKIKDQLDKRDLLPQLDKSNPFNRLKAKSEISSVSAA